MDKWIQKGSIKLHAQPRGLILHNLAGNAFSVGITSLYYGLITKNVNLVKLPREDPFFMVKLGESLLEIDKKLRKRSRNIILEW